MERLEAEAGDAGDPQRRPPSSRAESFMSSVASFRSDLGDADKWRNSRWRHPLGIALLLVTVFLWTTSNFLASTLFADNTYSKPFFVTFVNSSFFIIPLFPILLREYRKDPYQFQEVWDAVRSSTARYTRLEDAPDDDVEDAPSPDDDGKPPGAPSDPGQSSSAVPAPPPADQKLTLLETAKLSLEFSVLWFSANYFASACLEYTTVGSATILTSTSSVWTLLFGAFMRVERFSVRKLLGVAASLAGLALVSGLDVAGRGGGGGGGGEEEAGGTGGGTFPHKTARELAVGDALALIGAVIYGIYAVVLKARIGSESRANLPLFFGLVGLFNALVMWPAFLFLHVTGVERFELPPTWRVLTIILINSTSSLVSDFCWALAMLLTSPLLVTVGLSLTIPLSLVAQIFIGGVYADFAYWLGALVVLCSFIFINHEETKDEAELEPQPQPRIDDGAAL